MGPNDSHGFFTRLLALADFFDKKLSPDAQQLYFEALRDLDFEAVAGALNTAVKTCTFMPKPVEIRKLIYGDADEQAEFAWFQLLVEVRKVGMYGTPTVSPAVAEVVRRVWGGWRELCATLPNGGPELLGWAKRFTSAYVAITGPSRLALPSVERRELKAPDEDA